MYLTQALNKVAGEIDAHIRKCGGSYRDWYVGIASNPRDRLFNDHNVDEKGGSWIYKDAGSESAARQVESYFIDKGCKGGGGGGDASTRYVYAYRITSTTKE